MSARLPIELFQKSAEEADCLRDYRRGLLTKEEYEACLEFQRDADRRYRKDYARGYHTWAEIAQLMGRTRDAEFISSVASYIERKGFPSSKQSAVLDRMKKRYTQELRNPAQTLKRLQQEKVKREKAEAEAAKAERDRVRALSKFDQSKWNIQRWMDTSGDSEAFYQDGPYSIRVFWFEKRVGKVDKATLTVKRDDEYLRGYRHKWVNDSPEDVMALGLGVIEQDRKGEAEKPKATGGKDEQLEALDALLARRPDRFIQSIRDQVAKGRDLSEKQLKAVRQNFYRNRMRDKADLFRVASMKTAKYNLSDEIQDAIWDMDQYREKTLQAAFKRTLDRAEKELLKHDFVLDRRNSWISDYHHHEGTRYEAQLVFVDKRDHNPRNTDEVEEVLKKSLDLWSRPKLENNMAWKVTLGY